MRSVDNADVRVAQEHFIRRAPCYDHSASWVVDAALLAEIEKLAMAQASDCLLDVAVGTGQVAGAFRGKVRFVAGIDICAAMAARARERGVCLATAAAERLPFRDAVFDVCVCRQGLQFMDVASALAEMYRVLKPGGRVVLAHLAAYGEKDKETTFLIQRLRNPARRNFFLPEDFRRLLATAGFSRAEVICRRSRESVNRWIENGAIDAARRGAIRQAYRAGGADFRKTHDVEFKDGDIFDSMNMVLAKADKEIG